MHYMIFFSFNNTSITKKNLTSLCYGMFYVNFPYFCRLSRNENRVKDVSYILLYKMHKLQMQF